MAQLRPIFMSRVSTALYVLYSDQEFANVAGMKRR
jgi:hypothetical protein